MHRQGWLSVNTGSISLHRSRLWACFDMLGLRPARPPVPEKTAGRCRRMIVSSDAGVDGRPGAAQRKDDIMPVRGGSKLVGDSAGETEQADRAPAECPFPHPFDLLADVPRLMRGVRRAGPADVPREPPATARFAAQRWLRWARQRRFCRCSAAVIRVPLVCCAGASAKRAGSADRGVATPPPRQGCSPRSLGELDRSGRGGACRARQRCARRQRVGRAADIRSDGWSGCLPRASVSAPARRSPTVGSACVIAASSSARAARVGKYRRNGPVRQSLRAHSSALPARSSARMTSFARERHTGGEWLALI